MQLSMSLFGCTTREAFTPRESARFPDTPAAKVPRVDAVVLPHYGPGALGEGAFSSPSTIISVAKVPRVDVVVLPHDGPGAFGESSISSASTISSVSTDADDHLVFNAREHHQPPVDVSCSLPLMSLRPSPERIDLDRFALDFPLSQAELSRFRTEKFHRDVSKQSVDLTRSTETSRALRIENQKLQKEVEDFKQRCQCAEDLLERVREEYRNLEVHNAIGFSPRSARSDGFRKQNEKKKGYNRLRAPLSPQVSPKLGDAAAATTASLIATGPSTTPRGTNMLSHCTPRRSPRGTPATPRGGSQSLRNLVPKLKLHTTSPVASTHSIVPGPPLTEASLDLWSLTESMKTNTAHKGDLIDRKIIAMFLDPPFEGAS